MKVISDPFTLYCHWLLCGCGAQCSNSQCLPRAGVLLSFYCVSETGCELSSGHWLRPSPPWCGPICPETTIASLTLWLGEFPDSAAVKCYVNLYIVCIWVMFACKGWARIRCLYIVLIWVKGEPGGEIIGCHLPCLCEAGGRSGFRSARLGWGRVSRPASRCLSLSLSARLELLSFGGTVAGKRAE